MRARLRHGAGHADAGDAAQDLVTVVDRATTISNSIVDNQQNLDAFLVNMIGLAA